MESWSVHSSAPTSISPSLSRSGSIWKPCLHFHSARSRRFRQSAGNLKFLNIRAQVSSVEAIPTKSDPKYEDIAFVAGATGKVGSRTVRELLKLGFQVRAGTRDAGKAETLVQSVKEMKLGLEARPVERLKIVECDLEKPDQIKAALGNASVVICCIGAGADETFDILGPYRIDYRATKNLIDAATVAKVRHFIMVSSVGTNKFGFPIAILNLLWGILIWKRKAEESLIASGLPYTIVRPGGMERAEDDFKETHNIALSSEDTLFGGFVSSLQVAELISVMVKNRGLSYCKVVEVVAETTAPSSPMEELLAKIPSQRTPPKETDVTKPDPPPSKSAVSEAQSALTGKEPPMKEAKATRSLSPYAIYEDLKPPTSPSPTPSTTPRATETTVADTLLAASEVKKTRPLSPYFVYDDLKPPVSPIPTAPSGRKQNVNVVDTIPKPRSSDTETSISEMENIIAETKSAPEELQKTRPLSPYVAYENLKPPTSPSPSAPAARLSMPALGSGSQMSSGNGTAQPPPVDEPNNEKHHADTKQRPLSPFTMYEDMRPPTSPMPSPRK